MIEYGLEWHTLDSYFQFKEITAPATPQANQIRQYASDASGVSTICWKNDAGAVVCLPTTAGTLITGSGAADQVTIWSGASTITGGASAKITNLAGTTALVLKGTPNSFVKIDGDATGNPYLEWAQNGTAQARFQYLDSDDSLALSGGPAAVERWRFKADGDLIIGHTANPVTAFAGRGFALVRSGGVVTVEADIFQYGASGLAAGFRASSTRGTVATPTQGLTDDGSFVGFGTYDNTPTNYSNALITGQNGETQTSTAHGSYLTLHTTALLSTTRTERFRVGPSGQWGIGGATYGSSGDIFSSGGASAAPTWVTRATLNAALDHNVLTNLAVGDVHTQYALLAGRSGGQTLIGGTAAADDFTLRATAGVGVGSETILFQLGNNGAIAAGGFGESSSKAGLFINESAFKLAGSQLEVHCGTDINFNTGAGVLDTAAVAFQAFNDAVTANISIEYRALNHKFYSPTINVISWTIDNNGLLKAADGTYLDLSAISAGTTNMKITATSDTPTVTWTALGTNPPSTAPAGYLEILVGASTRYIPFWA